MSSYGRELRVIAMHLIAHWMPQAAPFIPPLPPFCAEHPFPRDVAESDSIVASKSNMADCARLIVAAGRRGAQRLAVAVVAAEDAARSSPKDAVMAQYKAIVRVLLLFATTTAREFMMTEVTTESTTVETTTRNDNATHTRVATAKARVVIRTTVAADPDAEDRAETQLLAPLAHAALSLCDGGVASVLAEEVQAACRPDSGDWFEVATAGRFRRYDAAPGAVSAALQPRELEIRQQSQSGVPVASLLPWIRQQHQLRSLRVTASTSEGLDAVIRAACDSAAGLQALTLLNLPELLHSSTNVTSFLFKSSVPNGSSGFLFPALRILRVPEKEIHDWELRTLAAAAPGLEILEAREHADITPDDWSQVLGEAKSLHTLLMAPPLPARNAWGYAADVTPTVPAFYAALCLPDFAPVCRLRVVERMFDPTPDVMHAVLNAVADQLPDLESFALPVEIFNALALVTTADEIVKAQLRRAVTGATRRCKNVTLQSKTGRVQLHVDACVELLYLLPNLQRLGPIAVASEVTADGQLLARSSAAKDFDLGENPGNGLVTPQLRELYLNDPLSRAGLATVASACPHLRVLRCHYSGPRPLVKMDPNLQPQYVPLIAEAVFIDWLDAIVDVGAVKYSTATTPAAIGTPIIAAQPQVLHGLRRLRVKNPPFDGERDAAAMGALERLRAHSCMLIEFE